MGRRRRRDQANTTQRCPICLGTPSLETPSYPPCSDCQSANRSNVCESCLVRHVISRCSNGNNDPVRCPGAECQSHLPIDVIRRILIRNASFAVWREYYDRRSWKGTTADWINRFTVQCPSCRVSIEKNGGCDHMRCSRCSSQFSWTAARNGTPQKTCTSRRRLLQGLATFLKRCLVVIILLLATAVIVFYGGNIRSFFVRLLRIVVSNIACLRSSSSSIYALKNEL